MIKDCGLIEYAEGWELQKQVFEAVGKGSEAQILLCEHPHVYTLGKSGERANLLISEEMLTRIGASYYHSDRGGDITYHGQGQIVAYPILDLHRLNISLREYIFRLEKAVIDTVAQWGIEAGRREGATGVWLEADTSKGLIERKICAIGVRVSRGVTMHGLALNVTTDLNYFNYINPCGFVDKGVSSLEKELEWKGDKRELFEAVKSVLAAKLEEEL